MGPIVASSRGETPRLRVNPGQPGAPNFDSTTAGALQTTASGVPAKPTDDQILGIAPGSFLSEARAEGNKRDSEMPTLSAEETMSEMHPPVQLTEEPEHLRSVLDANPELRSAWQQAKEYKQSFETPDKAREAIALLADLNRMDSLFFSNRPEDHTQLARVVAELNPVAFQSFAKAIVGQLSQQESTDVAKSQATLVASSQAGQPQKHGSADEEGQHFNPNQATEINNGQLLSAQSAFLQAANASAVEGVMLAIESHVEKLLPEGISKSARNRIAGEIYRELDASLQSNKELGSQTREVLRSGRLDMEHQRAVVSLITSRARQALPGVAKRVLGEWTTTLVAANQERRTRQRAAESRVDIAGAGGASIDGRRPLTPREIDYARMSDGDILNLF